MKNLFVISLMLASSQLVSAAESKEAKRKPAATGTFTCSNELRSSWNLENEMNEKCNPTLPHSIALGATSTSGNGDRFSYCCIAK